MIVLGVILLLLGLLGIGPAVLTTIGVVLIVVGLLVNLVSIGGTRRRVY